MNRIACQPLLTALILTVGMPMVKAEDAAAPAPSAPFLEILPQPILTGLIHLPGLLVTEADTILLIAQSRLKKGDRDPSDVVLTRSTDQGRTWSPPQKLFDSGNTGRCGYSCVLVEDRTTTPHTILAFYTIGPSKWKPDQLVWHGRRSTDEGESWSEAFVVKNDGHAQSKPSNFRAGATCSIAMTGANRGPPSARSNTRKPRSFPSCGTTAVTPTPYI